MGIGEFTDCRCCHRLSDWPTARRPQCEDGTRSSFFLHIWSKQTKKQTYIFRSMHVCVCRCVCINWIIFFFASKIYTKSQCFQLKYCLNTNISGKHAPLPYYHTYGRYLGCMCICSAWGFFRKMRYETRAKWRVFCVIANITGSSIETCGKIQIFPIFYWHIFYYFPKIWKLIVMYIRRERTFCKNLKVYFVPVKRFIEYAYIKIIEHIPNNKCPQILYIWKLSKFVRMV